MVDKESKIRSWPLPIDLEKLKPLLHVKIERMEAEHLSLFNCVMLQIEAEELADRLNDAFDQEHEQGRLSRIPELVKQFRAEPG